MHVKNLLRALYKNYHLFTIHFKELFWLVNFGNIIQSEHSLHILSEMIWFIDRPILLAPYFLIVQSEELLLLKPVIFTKNSMVHDLDVLSISLLTYLVLYYTMQRSLNDFFAKNRNKTVKRKNDSNSDDDGADPNNNVTNVGEPVQCQLWL